MVPEVIVSKLNQYQKFAFYAHTLLKSFFSSAVLSAPWCVLTIFVLSYAILRFIWFSNVGKFWKQFSFPFTSWEGNITVKLGDKERLDSEQLSNSEPFPVTSLLVYFINSKQPGVSEQSCDDQKVPYHQVWQ